MKRKFQKFLRGPVARLFARAATAGTAAGFEYVRASTGSDYKAILVGAATTAAWAAFEYFTPANAAVGAKIGKQRT